ncbi:latent-transforming growth factor beta-binding protein 2-like protein [Lates japonicus]|uniref:Latent-transforming growth factor beta-binding protein 2-like protein n=1 Tax=Lates japonicus TaxID=270547 RepID=A0AAD3MZV0_LATJO|nr:latent-transforming growth factor beta-binding protein 2-like protein [Lates japonicus]
MSLESVAHLIHRFIPKLEVKQTLDEAMAPSQPVLYFSFELVSSGSSIFWGPLCFRSRLKGTLSDPGVLSSIAITGSVQQVEPLFAPSGALFDRQCSSLPRAVAAFLPAISDCQPPCQNRGSCSRPHTCVCRSGFQGPRCEEVAPEQVYIRDGGGLRRVQPGTNPFQRDQPRRRPSERQAIDTTKVQTPRPVTTRQPVHTV